VLAGLERAPRVLVVVRVGGPDVDDVDVGIGDEVAVAAVGARGGGRRADARQEVARAARVAAAGGGGDDGVLDVRRGARGGRGEDVLGEDCPGQLSFGSMF
jgi:hypothetical protein